MTGRLTFRSPLAIVAALTNTAPFAAFIVVVLVALWSEVSGADWVVAYGAAAVALALVVLPLTQRFTVSSDTVVVANTLVRTRMPWHEVAEIRVERLRAVVFWYFGFWATGIVIRKTSDIQVSAYATLGLGARARGRLVAAIAAAAAQHGFQNEVTAESARVASFPGEDRGRDEVDTAWTDDPDLVECVFCGRVASRDEMQRIEQPGPLAWHCRDGDVCTAGETVRPPSSA